MACYGSDRLCLLRKHLIGLLAIVKKIKAGPVEAEFEREVKELESVAAAELPKPQAPALLPEKEELIRLAQMSPRAAILEAWRRVELAARRVLSEKGVTLNSREIGSPLAHAKNLAERKLLSPEELALFNDLRSFRNVAAHAEDFAPTVDAALSYIDIALRVQQALQSHQQNADS